MLSYDLQIGTEKVRGVNLTVFKSLPPAFADYWRPWLREHRKRTWLIYEEERYTFAEVESPSHRKS